MICGAVYAIFAAIMLGIMQLGTFITNFNENAAKPFEFTSNFTDNVRDWAV